MALRRKRAAEGERCPAVVYQVEGDPFAESHPELAAFLTAERFPDGAPRTTGTVNVSFSDLRVRVCLNDREAGEYCFVSAVTITEAFLAIETGLAMDALEWRRSGQRPGKRG